VYVCGENHLEECENEEDCLDFEGYWYDDSCHEFEEGAECDSNHKELCENPADCVDVNGYWYGNSCNSEEEVFENRPYFEFVPGEMDLVVLVGSERPVYSFTLRNKGKSKIDNLRLEYNKVKFKVTPEENISIGANESFSFSLEVLQDVRGQSQGAIVASSGDYNEYMLVKFRGTENSEEVSTNYVGGDEGYKCIELGGLECGSGETCSSSLVSSIDTNSCCTGTCVEPEGSGSKSWIGYLIAGIIVLAGIILFLKYRKTGKKESPTKQRFAVAEKRLP
ncbi:MAG: hypothetical protein KC506_03895, partial [Nanoarchaeota archaeon]|nr:hypothetical protein [Nanoarchaeota archaeon]